MRQIIKRKLFQKITSWFGMRKGFKFFHYGWDLRVYEDHPETGKPYGKKLKAVLPERCKFLRTVYQKKWGFTHVFKGLESGYTLKFIHVEERRFIKGQEYNEGFAVGYSRVTPYMKSKKFYDHLHFGVFKKLVARNPKKYCELMGIKYE